MRRIRARRSSARDDVVAVLGATLVAHIIMDALASGGASAPVQRYSSRFGIVAVIGTALLVLGAIRQLPGLVSTQGVVGALAVSAVWDGAARPRARRPALVTIVAPPTTHFNSTPMADAWRDADEHATLVDAFLDADCVTIVAPVNRRGNYTWLRLAIIDGGGGGSGGGGGGGCGSVGVCTCVWRSVLHGDGAVVGWRR